MNEKIISGIQQVGIGVPNVHEAWKWYKEHFGVDIRVFEKLLEVLDILAGYFFIVDRQPALSIGVTDFQQINDLVGEFIVIILKTQPPKINKMVARLIGRRLPVAVHAEEV